MDYKAVIEEQIKKLQQRQDKLPDNQPYIADESCKIAETIASLVQVATAMK